ncbi:acyltransferase [soil metagenome]
MTQDESFQVVPTKTLPSLTGLRFLAALAVFGTHSFWRIADGPANTALSLIFTQGFAGVSFFFVLSGFILVWSRRDSDTPRAFYRRRVARIVPTYFLALVLSVAWSVLVKPERAGQAIIESLPSFAALQAWIPVEDIYLGGNLPGWSLSAEAFFYLLFPALIVLMATARRRWMVGAVAVTLIVVVPIVLYPVEKHSVDYWILYVLPAQRLAEFALGMILAILMRRGWRFPIPLWFAVVVAGVAYLLMPHVPHAFNLVLVMALPFLMLVGAVAQSDLDGRRSVLATPVMVRLGEWSYAFYLFHYLVLGVVFTAFAGVFAESMTVNPALGIGAMLVALLVTVAVSAGVYRLYERPLEKRIRGQLSKNTVDSQKF